MGQHGGMTVTPPTAALILAGGRGTRMGGVDKPGLLVHGRRLLDIALSATAHLDAVVVVGPHRPELDPGITQTQETPAGAGPVEAIWAGLSATRLPDDAVVVVLASDLPHIEAVSVDALIAATSTDSPVDVCRGREQPNPIPALRVDISRAPATPVHIAGEFGVGESTYESDCHRAVLDAACHWYH